MGQTKLFIVFVYGSNYNMIQIKLWNELINLQQENPSPWCMLANYNAVIGLYEKFGRCSPIKTSTGKFLS